MFPTIRNLQIRVHVYRPRHYCGAKINYITLEIRSKADFNSKSQNI
jgi:hypothetical protein